MEGTKNGLIEKIRSDRRYRIGIGTLVFAFLYFILDAFMTFDNDLITGAVITYVGMVLGFYFNSSEDDKKENLN